jgi:ABC-type transport system involved in multi-copper enzyme maturation permease subunit
MQAFYHWFWRLIPGNPQVVRIVQGGSRRTQHALVRMGYLGALIALVTIGMLSAGGLGGAVDLNDLAKAGSQVFRVISYGQVVLVCLLAPIFMAGAIASEQSGKTYNILLTTPLSNLQIVLGSLLGRLFFILTLLLSGLPLFAVMLVFGGVPVSSVFVAFAVAGLTALFVGAVAVVLSVMRAGGRKAVFVFVISIAAYLVVVGALDMVLLRNLGPTRGHTTVLTPLHPLLVLQATINKANYAPPGPEQLAQYPALVRFYLGQPFAAFAAITALLSVLMVLFCSLWVRRIGTGDSKAAIWIKAKLRLAEQGAERVRSARQLGNGNPIAWREANTRGKLAGGILARYGFVVLGLIGLGLLLYYYHTDPFWKTGQQNATPGSVVSQGPAEWFYPSLMTLLIAEVVVISLVALYMSAGSVSKEREDGTLDIMLTTPITPRYYVWGKLRGLVRFLSVMIALPVISLAIFSAYTLVGRFSDWPQASLRHVTYTNSGFSGFGSAPTATTHHVPLALYESPLLLLLMLVPFIALCVAIGMFWSLKAKGVLGAVVPSVAIIGAGAVVLSLCGLPASSNIPLVGPVLNAFSPATNIVMLVNPYEFVERFAEEPVMGRVSLFIGAFAVCGGYATVVWAMIAAMVRGFDHTVRRLSGTK